LSPELLAAPLAGWTAAHGRAAAGPVFTVYAVVQAILFAAVALLACIPAVRRTLTPRALKQRRVRRAALQHFAGARLHLRPGRPMVLIFASLADRQMEIIADEAIDAAVADGVWDETVAQALAEIRMHGPGAGLAKAVALCGATLARHFPDDGGANAFPDRALEL
jgi:putative membrane protein